MKALLLFWVIILLSQISFGQAKPTIETSLITSITTSGSTFTLHADFVKMLTGNAAVKAAKKNGEADYDVSDKGDTSWYVVNDYYVLNGSTKTKKLVLSPAAQIYLVKPGTSLVAKSKATVLKQSFEGRLFKLEILNNQVIKITEIYTP